MNAYLYAALQQEAKTKGVWIDTQSDNIMRGQDSDNTNKKERVSRALSWHKASEDVKNADERLIFSVIAFDALYIQERKHDDTNQNDKRGNSGNSERDKFWEKISDADVLFKWDDSQIELLVKILSFPFLSDKYWSRRHENEVERKKAWEKQKNQVEYFTRKQIRRKIATPLYLAIKKTYLLRDQLLHGMAAYQDWYNRTQVGLCSEFMPALVGRVIAAVIASHIEDWGKVPYPPQGRPDETCDFKVEDLKE